MKIGYDGQALFTGSATRGIGRYCYQFLKAVLRLYPDNQYVLFTNALHREEQPFPEGKNLVHRAVQYLPGHGLKPVNDLIQYSNYYAEDLDILHVLSPLEERAQSVVQQKPFPSKTVLTLYDLIPMLYPHGYLTSAGARRSYFDKIKMYDNADLILTISEWSRTDAIRLLGVPPGKIVNVGIAPGEAFAKLDHLPPDEVVRVQAKYKLPSYFILYVGSIDARKNVDGLIYAYSELSKVLRDKYTLVVACAHSEVETAPLEQLAESLTPPGRVRFLHFVPDHELNLLYNTCSLFVLPSLYEGAGLPVLEAMRCGAPVVAGCNSSVPEIMGRTDNLFAPENPISIARAMAKVLTNDVLSSELRDFGIRRAAEFNWDAVAKAAMKTYMDLAGVAVAGVRSAMARRSGEPQSLRLGLLTTWNTKCGIANYSKYLTRHLPADSYVECTILARYDTVLVGTDGTNVLRCWDARRGTEKAMQAVLDLEIDLVDIMFNHSFLSVDQLAQLIVRLKRSGKRVIVTIHEDLAGLSEAVVELSLADAIIVFNQEHSRELAGLGVRSEIIELPQGILRYDDEDIGAVRRSLGISNSQVIASTGFLLPHKGVLETIKAMPELLLTHPDLLYFVVCFLHLDASSADYFQRCLREVHELGLDKHVRFSVDYLDEPDVIRLLHSADMLVLPYTHTNQPTSAAIRFALSAGRPVVATDLPIFSDFGPEIYRIRESDPKLIAAAVSSLYGSRELYQSLAASAAARIERDSWEAVSQRYSGIVRRCASRKPSADTRWLSLVADLSEQMRDVPSKDVDEAVDLLSQEVFRLQLLHAAS